MKYEYFLVPKSNIFGSSPCNYFTKQKDFSTKTFLLNEILFYQLFLVVSPYYHLLLPALQNTQYHNHLQRKGEVLSYEKVNVEEKLFKSFFAFPRNSGVLNILIGVVFFTFFYWFVSFYSCSYCQLVTCGSFYTQWGYFSLLYIFCPFSLLCISFSFNFNPCLFSFFPLKIMTFLLWYFIYKLNRYRIDSNHLNLST